MNENERNIKIYAEKINTRTGGDFGVESESTPLVEGGGRNARLTEAGKRAAASYAYALITAPEVLDLPSVEATFDWAKDSLTKERENSEKGEFRDYARLLNSSLRMRERYLKNIVSAELPAEEQETVQVEPEITVSKPKFVNLNVIREKIAGLKNKVDDVLDEADRLIKDGLLVRRGVWGTLAIGVLGACTMVYSGYGADISEPRIWRELNKPPIVQALNIQEQTENVSMTWMNTPVTEQMATVKPTAFPVISPELVPVAEVKAPNYYEWVEQGLNGDRPLNLSETFKLVLPQETASVYGKKNPTEFIPESIEVHKYNSPAEVTAADWGANFGRNVFESKNDLAIQQGNNNRAVVYGHSGSIAGFEWPFEFVKNAAWYEEHVVGRNIEILQGGYKYVYRIEQINTVTKKDFESASRQYSDKERPLMKDMAVLGVNEQILNLPGIDFVACGGKQVSMKDYRTIVSTVLVSQEKMANEELGVANYYESEYLNETLPNVELAAKKVNDNFSKNALSPGETWSYLETMDYFSQEGWVRSPDFIEGAGACDVATMMYRAVENYSKSLGLPPFEKTGYVSGAEVWSNVLFKITKYPHTTYPGMPADEISVLSLSKGPDGVNSDMTIFLSESIGKVSVPEDIELRFKITQDANGNFKTVVVSNYSAEELQNLIKRGLAIEKK